MKIRFTNILSVLLALTLLISSFQVLTLPTASAASNEGVFDFECAESGTSGWGKKWGDSFAAPPLDPVERSEALSRSGNTGSLQVNLHFTGGDYESAVIGVPVHLDVYDKVEYDLYIPVEFNGQSKAETGMNGPWVSLGGMDTYHLSAQTKETINGQEYAVIHRISSITPVNGQTDLIIQFAAYQSTYVGPIYVDNIKLAHASSSGGESGGGSGPAKEVASFTFDDSPEGWGANTEEVWKAEFGTPAIQHSTFNGGALQVNAVIADPNEGWQELRINNAVPELPSAKRLAFETYIPLDDLANEYEGKLLKPYAILDPGWTKVGLDSNNKKISDMEKITVEGKTYAKHEVSIVLSATEGKTALHIGLVAGGISYSGPIYVDNIKLYDKAFANGGVIPVVIPDPAQPVIDTTGFDLSDITIVDSKATDETKSLFAYLRNIRGKHMLFGQQHSTTQGLTITAADGTQSDVKNAVGDFPAVYGWDTLSLEGQEEPGGTGNSPEQNAALLADVMVKAYQRNGIITLSAHMPNFLTGGGSWDTTPGVQAVLPGGSHQEEFNEFLDRIADFASQVKDGETLVPIIFRPFHENTGSWFWWGATQSTPAQYISLYRYTVEYLRDVKGVSNFLYAYSPNNGFDEAGFLKRYPGDEYVDIIGFDAYDTSYAQGWMDGIVENTATLAKLARERGKVAALTEIGLKQYHDSSKSTDSGLLLANNANKNWFTQLLEAIKSDPDAREAAFMLTWRNGGASHFWTPYRDHPTYGSHEMLDNFTTFYNDPYTAFNKQLQGVYGLNVKAAGQAPFMNVQTPYEHQKITGPFTIRAGVYNKPVSSVTFSVAGGPAIALSKNVASGYFEAEWTPSVAHNGTEVDMVITVTYTDNDTLTVNRKVSVYAALPLKTIEFTDGLEGAVFEGSYPTELVSGSLKHSSTVGGGAVQLDTVFEDSGTSSDWTYQEVKVKLQDVAAGIDMSQVNRIQYDMLLPADAPDSTAFKPYASLSNSSGLFVKAGEGLTQVRKEDFSLTDSMYKYTVTIPFDSQAEATDLSLNFVANDWNYTGPIYFDNVKLQNYQAEPVENPAIVDDFEGYDGDSTLLDSSYSSNGDPVALTLDETKASQGKYALKYQYTLTNSQYGGRIKPMGGRDWSAFKKLRFNLTPDGQNQKLVIQIAANGIEFEAFPSLASTQPGVVEIPFLDFAPKTAGAKLEGNNLKKINHFAIYVNAQGNTPVSGGTLYFDDIRAVDDTKPENPENPGNPGNPGNSDDSGDSGSGSGGTGGLPPSTDSKAVDVVTPKPNDAGKIVVSLPKGKTEAWLSADHAAINGNNDVVVEAEGAKIEIPASLLNELKQLLPAADATGTRIVFRAVKIAGSAAEAQLKQAKSSAKADLNIAGPVYQLELSILAKDGTEKKLSDFKQPVKIEFRVNADAKKELAGIYDLSDDNRIPYVKSRLVGDVLVAELTQFGKFAVLEFDKSYEDVPATHWAAQVVKRMAARHITEGISETEFGPELAVTRAEFAAWIVRALDLKASKSANFADVPSGAWYANDLAAAHEAGIVDGRSSELFDPLGVITREEMAVMLMKAYFKVNGNGEQHTNSASFADQSDISSWAESYVSAGKEKGIFSGVGGNLFSPKELLTRAQGLQAVTALLK
ncbi:glycosyl hydrolase [Paenibacillus puerhi]|uniref:glycosyl hydrolase n=1 Tax=Paenibacillus puerhi TaxID=2692622 RepID=UPI00135A1D69|nr:glycosyl hydrolase [Paenibacillus puerhi]